MALSKETIISGIQLDTDKVVFVHEDTVIKEDDVEISRTFSRHVIHPHMDISGEDSEVQAVANAVWTDDVKTKWAKHLEDTKV